MTTFLGKLELHCYLDAKGDVEVVCKTEFSPDILVSQPQTFTRRLKEDIARKAAAFFVAATNDDQSVIPSSTVHMVD